MSVLDLTDAYLTVPVDPEFYRYLKFAFQNRVYCYVCMPFGLSSAPRKFTKLMKPIIIFLREKGIVLIIYIDDIWVTAQSYHSCLQSVLTTARLLSSLGFLINRKKSKPEPSQCVHVLGYIVNSVSMRVYLPKRKEEDIITCCKTVLSQTVSIRTVAKVLGKIVASFPAFQLARAHYRYLEADKTRALKLNGFQFDKPCHVSFEAKMDLLWILQNVVNVSAPVKKPLVDLELFVDASQSAWGARLLHMEAKGFFAEDELCHSINSKETLAVWLALCAFQPFIANQAVLVRSDNTTAVSTIAKMGTLSNLFRDDIVRKIWDFSNIHNISLSIAHIPGVDNPADYPSRNLTQYTEWELHQTQFQTITAILGHPEVDLFASRLNNKLKTFVSWKPDPFAFKIDAFSFHWGQGKYYAFPPFILISRILSKIITDKATLILVFPLWKSQPWYPLLTSLLASPIILLSRPPQIHLPWDRTLVHPLSRTLQLGSAILSGNSTYRMKYQQKLRSYSSTVSDRLLVLDTDQALKLGRHMPKFMI